MADYVTVPGQLTAMQAEVSALGSDLTTRETRELLRAWLWLAEAAEAAPILRYFTRRVVQRAEGPHDEGARRFLLGIFEQMVEARKMQDKGH